MTGIFSEDENPASDGDWSGSESASVIAERIRQQAAANRIGRTASNFNDFDAASSVAGRERQRGAASVASGFAAGAPGTTGV
jgi:hypothetical protein